ncbi:extracellular solute-binding protein [Ruminococcaceae bacterium OttesenSCG-928-L11]|nr:extracellular solute-binding protein [Ruminococcaceae bacterium OttesenSCG-928-L11]
MKKRLFACLLTSVMLVAAFGGCGGNGGEPVSSSGGSQSASGSTSSGAGSDASAEEGAAREPGSMPISEEPITVRIVVPMSAERTVSLNDLDMLKEFSEKSNVTVEWDEISNTAFAEKYKLLLATNDLPDAFGPAYAYESTVIFKYGQEGSIIPLEGLIEEYGVNTKKWFDEREDFRKLSTYPDGHIYALPSLDENQNIRVEAIWWINDTYLQALGMEQPKTLDEMGEYLRAVSSQDLNGDGRNEIGLSFEIDTANANIPSRLTYLIGYFGDPWDEATYMTQSKEGKGPLEFAPGTDATRKALEYFHQWYSEGLIDPEIFTQNNQQLKSKAKTEGVGASLQFWHLTLNDGDESQNAYRVVDMPQNADGTAVWRRNRLIPGYTANQFFITSENKYPAETLQYIDYWLDNSENALQVRFGPQGYSWDYVEDGKWTELANIPSGEPRTEANSSLVSPWGYGIPYWCFGDFWAQKHITAAPALERQASLNASGSYIDNATVGLPELIYTEEENQEILQIKPDLFNYVNNQFAKFVTGGVTDQGWDDYQKQLAALGADRYAELYNKYYDIFNS